MIILRKDKDGIVTGGHTLRFSGIHIFFIGQTILILSGLLSNNANWQFLLLPTLLVGAIVAILLLFGNIANGILGIINICRHQKTSVSQYIWAVIVAAQVLALILPLFGVQNLGGFALMKFFYCIHVIISSILFALVIIIEVISDICLLLGLTKIGFALKDSYKMPLKAAQAKQEKANKEEEA